MTTPIANRGSRSLMTHLTLAGVAALAGSAANAQVTVVPVNENIGYAPGDLSSFTSSLPGVGQFTIEKRGVFVFSNGKPVVANSIGFSNAYVNIRVNSSFAAIAAAGRKYNSIGSGIQSTAGIAAVLPSGRTVENGLFQDQYFAFNFQDAGNPNQTDYGWIKASLTDNSFNGLNMNISEYAYDTSGEIIETGQTNFVPEPSGSQLAIAGFCALTLGAAGVRRLKALRNG